MRFDCEGAARRRGTYLGTPEVIHHLELTMNPLESGEDELTDRDHVLRLRVATLTITKLNEVLDLGRRLACATPARHNTKAGVPCACSRPGDPRDPCGSWPR
jgi:hypothetical protein